MKLRDPQERQAVGIIGDRKKFDIALERGFAPALLRRRREEKRQARLRQRSRDVLRVHLFAHCLQ